MPAPANQSEPVMRAYSLLSELQSQQCDCTPLPTIASHPLGWGFALPRGPNPHVPSQVVPAGARVPAGEVWGGNPVIIRARVRARCVCVVSHVRYCPCPHMLCLAGTCADAKLIWGVTVPAAYVLLHVHLGVTVPAAMSSCM